MLTPAWIQWEGWLKIFFWPAGQFVTATVLLLMVNLNVCVEGLGPDKTVGLYFPAILEALPAPCVRFTAPRDPRRSQPHSIVDSHPMSVWTVNDVSWGTVKPGTKGRDFQGKCHVM